MRLIHFILLFLSCNSSWNYEWYSFHFIEKCVNQHKSFEFNEWTTKNAYSAKYIKKTEANTEMLRWKCSRLRVWHLMPVIRTKLNTFENSFCLALRKTTKFVCSRCEHFILCLLASSCLITTRNRTKRMAGIINTFHIKDHSLFSLFIFPFFIRSKFYDVSIY